MLPYACVSETYRSSSRSRLYFYEIQFRRSEEVVVNRKAYIIICSIALLFVSSGIGGVASVCTLNRVEVRVRHETTIFLTSPQFVNRCQIYLEEQSTDIFFGCLSQVIVQYKRNAHSNHGYIRARICIAHSIKELVRSNRHFSFFHC